MNSIATIEGTAHGNDTNLIIEWTCPTTGKPLQCQGEFNWDEKGYWHPVYDEFDNLLYIVTANV